ncbi:MAG TPA: BON domain-containing protein [bacterium]|nr:BON domain-containing protein [bacterium]
MKSQKEPAMSMTKEEKLELKIGKAKEAAPAGPQLDPMDEKLEAEIERAADLKAHGIKVVCRGGWVTLIGQVKDPGSKKALGAEASKVPGVKGVTNRIHIRKD